MERIRNCSLYGAIWRVALCPLADTKSTPRYKMEATSSLPVSKLRASVKVNKAKNNYQQTVIFKQTLLRKSCIDLPTPVGLICLIESFYFLPRLLREEMWSLFSLCCFDELEMELSDLSIFRGDKVHSFYFSVDNMYWMKICHWTILFFFVRRNR